MMQERLCRTCPSSWSNDRTAKGCRCPGGGTSAVLRDVSAPATKPAG